MNAIAFRSAERREDGNSCPVHCRPVQRPLRRPNPPRDVNKDSCAVDNSVKNALEDLLGSGKAANLLDGNLNVEGLLGQPWKGTGISSSSGS